MKGLEGRNSDNNRARLASLKGLLLPLLLFLAGLLSAPGTAIAQSTVNVCRETKKVLTQYKRESDEASRLADVKAREEEWRGVLSKLRRGIANGIVIPKLAEMAYMLKVAPPGSSFTEQMAFQRTFRDLLEKVIHETRDISLDELNARWERIVSLQIEPRAERMTALHCHEVLEREGEANLSGSWICKAKCPAGGEGKTASIAHNGEALTFTNEGGQSSAGRFTGSKSVVARGWGNLTGTIANDGKELRWANGTIWVKQ